jgi:hypothetical protein
MYSVMPPSTLFGLTGRFEPLHAILDLQTPSRSVWPNVLAGKRPPMAAGEAMRAESSGVTEQREPGRPAAGSNAWSKSG